jgi:hypothetical protein
MVKETTTRRPRPPVNKDGSLRRKPGKQAAPGDIRTERLVLRVHHDLMEVLSERARERGITRSAYVEQLLVGWVRLDPRNRKVDLIGKYDPGAPTPADLRQRSRVGFVERWRRFAEASLLLLGFEPPREWFENDDLEPRQDLHAAGWLYSDSFGTKPAAGSGANSATVPIDDEPPNSPVRRRR